MNYVNLFKKTYNIDYDSKYYDIHHIDCNHQNNSIENLMILPRMLHNEYHRRKSDYELVITDVELLKTIGVGNNGFTEYAKNCINEFLAIKIACDKWFDYKLYLEKKIT